MGNRRESRKPLLEVIVIDRCFPGRVTRSDPKAERCLLALKVSAFCTAILVAGILVAGVLAMTGCGKRNEGPTTADLLRQQQLRENEKLAAPKTIQERVATAQAFFEDDNLAAAEQELSRILITDPDDREALLLSAKVQAALKNHQDAVEILDSIVDSDPAFVRQATWLAADWMIESGDYVVAEEKLKQLLELDAEATRVHRTLATLMNNQGRRIDAAPHLLALAKLGNIREKELFAMTTYGNPFIDTTLPNPTLHSQWGPAILAKARVSRSEGEMQDAVALTERLRTAFPNSTPIAAFLGRLYTDLQNEEALMTWFSDLPESIEREPEYWSSTGLWLQRHDRHREAIRCLGEAVVRDPTNRFAYQALERSLRFAGEAAKADLALSRQKQLKEASQLARQFGSKRGTKQEMNRMADILRDLKRPWESVSWRETALKYYAGTDEEKKQLAQTRQELQQDDHSATPEFLACGLDLKSWPLPTTEDISHAIASQTPKPNVPGSVVPGSIDPGSIVPIDLGDVAASVGLDFTYDNGDEDREDDAIFIYQLTGGGIGVVDYNLDGWMDLYFTQGGGRAFDAEGSLPNQLFANQGGQRFQRVTHETGTGDRGYGQGVAIADLNQDGFPDLVIANIGQNRVCMNNGDGTFTARPVPNANGDQQGGWTTSIACGDLGGDHLPEIVAINYINDPQALTIPCTPNSTHCSPRVFQPAADSILQVQNNGDLVTWQGCQDISNQPNFGFAALLTDFDGKPGNELFIANDTRPNHFWTATQGESGTERVLSENAKLYGCGSDSTGRPRGCMGISHGDLDHNGRLDLHVTNYWNEASDVYLQRDTGLFVPANLDFGVFAASRKTVGWGTQAVDFDRNGWLDLAVLNGHVVNQPGSQEPYEMHPQLFQALSDGSSKRMAVVPSAGYWSDARLGRTMAVVDWNGDSKPDLVTNHLDAPVALLSNRTAGGNSLQIELTGTSSERDAIGARVTVTCGQQSWTQWESGGDGFLCSNEAVLDFGLANARSIDRVEVRWPSGQRQAFNDLRINQRYLLVEGEPDAFARGE